MNASLALLAAVILMLGWAVFYARWLARRWGEEHDRATPAITMNDGRDFVPSPTPVVFAHHFASIAGAGPIIGPVIALCYGWLPALLWVVVGGLLIGGVHDYLATFMATREGGHSIATVVRRLLGTGPFVALAVFLILTLGLVCATFLNLSATALTSMVPAARLGLGSTQRLFRIVGEGEAQQVVIGGIASTSVIVITAMAPLIGWLYLKRGVRVGVCSLLAIGVCVLSLVIGLRFPVALPDAPLLGRLQGPDIWKLILAAYVLVAAGVPVWIFLQSRDFINVHLLYAGLLGMAAALVTVSARGAGVGGADAIPVWDGASGARQLGLFWPALFITIACGAVSGFHSLCAGGTTCKQLRSEPATRQVGYGAMILESLLSLCVIGAVVLALRRVDYWRDVHPALLGLPGKANPILGFAMAVGSAAHAAFGLPRAAGALAGMVLLEGFLVTTLDTAIRLMRYLIEEVWHVLLGTPAAAHEGGGVTGGCGIPTAVSLEDEGPPSIKPPPWARWLGHYWVNSSLAVLITLGFAFSSVLMSLWTLFATANQLLAAFVLLLGTLWLWRRRRPVAAALLPGLFMLATTTASLLLQIPRLKPRLGLDGRPLGSWTLLLADLVLLALAVYIVAAGLQKWRIWKRDAPQGAG